MKTKVLFLGCNHNQIPYIRVLKEFNYKIIGADFNPDAPGRELCDRFYNVGYDDLKALKDIGEAEGFNSSSKVFTASAQFAHKGCSNFANYFDIPYPKEESIDFCLDKVAYYKYFLKNNIPLPKTSFVKNEQELRIELDKFEDSYNFYLKSDYSKNPNYVYKFNKDDVPFKNFFWGRDRYLKNFYILQEEYPGISLRINIYGNRFNVIDFYTSKYTHEHHNCIKKLKVINTLKDLMIKIGIQNWLIKFDIILGTEGYVVLDIGLDPPSRMKQKAIDQNLNFEALYIKHHLENIIEYPLSLD
tara:strand:+ start:384 stop:1286 length:903 start_codon:yes stop_codon:yes gene_type:complete